MDTDDRRRRVAVYVTRQAPTTRQLLVFDHAFDPDGSAGTQIPAGGVQPGESVAAAAVREVAEETGVGVTAGVRRLGDVEHLDGCGRPSLTTYVHAEASHEGSVSWRHRVVTDDDADDAGLVFVCRWADLPLDVELAGGQGVYLDLVS